MAFDTSPTWAVMAGAAVGIGALLIDLYWGFCFLIRRRVRFARRNRRRSREEADQAPYFSAQACGRP
jgi:hypothetical protein